MDLIYRLLCSYLILFTKHKIAGVYRGRPLNGFRNKQFDTIPKPYSIACEVRLRYIDGIQTSMVSRIVVVDQNLQVFHDSKVKPMRMLLGSLNQSFTEDEYRADSFYHTRTRIVQMLRFQILIGHKLNYYLRLLQMRHPVYLRRDTAHFSKFRCMNVSKRLSLEQLAKTFLCENLDEYANNVTANAITSMRLYLKYREEWDKEMKQRPLLPTMDAFAMKCEIVKGKRDDNTEVDVLAKVTIVDTSGAVVYQKMITPSWPIIDYRTIETNLCQKDFTNTVAIEYEREKLEKLLRGRVLVGHGLVRDLNLIGITHPYLLRRDSSTYDKFHRGLAPAQCETFKDIAVHFLDQSVLQSSRYSLDSAQTVMLLYLQYKREWDLAGKRLVEKSKEKRANAPRRKLITPVAVYYDRILVSSRLGQLKVIGRMVIVNGNYQCIYDRFVKPNNMTVLDCFTENTGIHMEDIEQGTSIEQIKDDLVNMLRDKILIGYNLKHFLLLVGLKFQIYYRRDLRLYNKFLTGFTHKPSITQIAEQFLNVSLTTYTHPVEKARIFMNLYYKYKEDWDLFVAHSYRDLKMVSLNKLIGNSTSTSHYKPISMVCNSVTIKNWGLLGYQMLARVTLVNDEGDCVYDKYVKPYSEIVDYRTNETGIHPVHLQQGEEYFKVLEDILQLISSKIIVGEQLSKCFKLMRHKADWWLLRDISLFSSFRRLNSKYLLLNDICETYLNYSLENPTDPVERAKALMQIYHKFKYLWEIEITRKHEVLRNKAKMFQEFRNDYVTRSYNRSHKLV